MNIACTFAPGRGDTDLILNTVALRLQARGYRVLGTVQINTEQEGQGPCDMDIKVLPNGPLLRISQSLGRDAQGCRLDSTVLETAVGLVGHALTAGNGDQAGADCLIINKFGKQEAEGRGFRDVIARAAELDIPVLVGLNRLNQAAFAQFSGGFAETLTPDADTIEHWFLSHVPTLEPAH